MLGRSSVSGIDAVGSGDDYSQQQRQKDCNAHYLEQEPDPCGYGRAAVSPALEPKVVGGWPSAISFIVVPFPGRRHLPEPNLVLATAWRTS